MGERLKKSLLNTKINIIFYFFSLIIAFFSRKIFLEGLGNDFVGLTGTLLNLLGFLNLAELGVGASIGFVLYKPIFQKDTDKITEIISVFGYLYRNIGLIILVAGVILSFFIPFIFAKTQIEIWEVYFAYYSYLATTLIGYFINYRQTLLGADQKNYVVTAYFQTMTIIKTLIQMAIAYYTGNYVLWISIELIFGISYSFVLNWKINQTYPWLKSTIRLGKLKYSDNKIIIEKAKQMFIHIIANVARYQLLPFLVYAFTTLKLVAFYGNYMLIISKINLLINNFFDGTKAGVGNLIAEGNKYNIQKVYWELNTVRFIISAFLTFSLYHLIDPFIQVWLGQEYILGNAIVIILIINFFLSNICGASDQFIYGYGLFQDTWAPIVALILTISVALLGGWLWGLPGIFLGDTVSSVFIIHIWKPYFLYSQGFHLSVWDYWKRMSKYLFIFALSWLISDLLIAILNLDSMASKGYLDWTIYALLSTLIFMSLYTPLMLIFIPSTKIIFKRFIKIKE